MNLHSSLLHSSHFTSRVKYLESRKWDSNPRPTHYECVALPTEPFRHMTFAIKTSILVESVKVKQNQAFLLLFHMNYNLIKWYFYSIFIQCQFYIFRQSPLRFPVIFFLYPSSGTDNNRTVAQRIYKNVNIFIF